MNAWLIIPITAAVVSALCTATAVRYARRRGLLDVPGPRSSHAEPTPRGGGVGIPVVLLGALTWLFVLGALPSAWYGGLGAGVLLVGATGWLEDHRPLDPRLRFAVQAAAAAVLVGSVGGLAGIDLGSLTLPLGWLGIILPFLALLWLTNLYNFMDGIDALAASEGIFAGIVMGAWLWASGEPGLAVIALCVAAACAGLLPWNLPRARIFMGDVGSTTLGFAFGGIALLGAGTGALPAVVSMIVLGLFVFDATFTLMSRIAKGERWYTPHREHAYQYLVRAGVSHGRAVLSLMAVNLLVILPVVLLVYLYPRVSGVMAGVGIAAASILWYGCRRRFAALARTPR